MLAGKAQQPIEIILLRQWASYIAIPTWIVDTNGDLIYYNEPAEPILGEKFENHGPINNADLARRFVTTAEDGSPIRAEELPIVVALNEGRPDHLRIRILGLDGTSRLINVSAFPVEGQGGRQLGAVAMFWEVPGE
jgi:PAS domain-containing protein